MSSGKPKMMSRRAFGPPRGQNCPPQGDSVFVGQKRVRVCTWGRSNPVDLKWIDTNKSTTEFPRHRSRLVGVEQVFQEDVPQVADPLLISIVDVCRAHFNADAVRNVYVRLPEEDSKSKEVGRCGKLRKTMCGTLNAAQTVERALCTGLRRRRILTRLGIPVPLFPQGPADLVHGDDCFIVGRQKGREHALDLLQAVYELSKVVTLGPGPSHSSNQSRSWEEHRHCESGVIEYEPETHSTSHAH